MIDVEGLLQIDLTTIEPLDFTLPPLDFTLPPLDSTLPPLDSTLPPLDLTPAFELALEYQSAPANEVDHGA